MYLLYIILSLFVIKLRYFFKYIMSFNIPDNCQGKGEPTKAMFGSTTPVDGFILPNTYYTAEELEIFADPENPLWQETFQAIRARVCGGCLELGASHCLAKMLFKTAPAEIGVFPNPDNFIQNLPQITILLPPADAFPGNTNTVSDLPHAV
jgi:hypothetical protein